MATKTSPLAVTPPIVAVAVQTSPSLVPGGIGSTVFEKVNSPTAFVPTLPEAMRLPPLDDCHIEMTRDVYRKPGAAHGDLEVGLEGRLGVEDCACVAGNARLTLLNS